MLRHTALLLILVVLLAGAGLTLASVSGADAGGAEQVTDTQTDQFTATQRTGTADTRTERFTATRRTRTANTRTERFTATRRPRTATETSGVSTPTRDGQATVLSFTRQATDGRTVRIDRVTVPNGGYVAIHDERVEPPDGDPVASIIGFSEYLPPGTHRNLTVTLSQPLNGSESQRVTARVYRDTNSNRVFDYVIANGSVDTPYQRSGQPISDPATVDLSEGTLPPTATFTLPEQRGGSSVLVEDITLSSGGFLVVTDADDDEVLGVSRYVPARRVGSVRVLLAQRPTSETNVTVRAYRDTNGDRVFSNYIPGSRVDQAYTNAGATETRDITFQRADTPTGGF